MELPKNELKPYQAIELRDLFNIALWQNEIPWQPFREGVEIYKLYGNGTGPSAALIRYTKGGHVPVHVHTGFEHIIVLFGSQGDQNGTYKAGTLLISPPDTQHSLDSTDGCIVLAIYEKPVNFTNVTNVTVDPI